MADKKVNTGLTAEQAVYALSRALKTMTADEILAEIDRQITAERGERKENDSTILANVAALQADLLVKYVTSGEFGELKHRVESVCSDLMNMYVNNETFNALVQRVAALEGGRNNA